MQKITQARSSSFYALKAIKNESRDGNVYVSVCLCVHVHLCVYVKAAKEKRSMDMTRSQGMDMDLEFWKYSCISEFYSL